MKQPNKGASFFRYTPKQQEPQREPQRDVPPGDRETELLDASMRPGHANTNETSFPETELLDAGMRRNQPAARDAGNGETELLQPSMQDRSAKRRASAQGGGGSWQYGPVNVIEYSSSQQNQRKERISDGAETVLLDRTEDHPKAIENTYEQGETELLSRGGALPGEPQNGETVLLDEPGVVRYEDIGAPIMQSDERSAPVLVRLRTGERFMVNKRVFRIGTDRANVDCWIRGNRAISRHHAEIIQRKGKYYIHDTNSLNFTYLNHVMIQANQEYLLHNFESIIFGNEEFRFEW